MAQPHKGDRKLVGTRLPATVHERVVELAAEAGLPVSQFIADFVALKLGLVDEIRELNVNTTLFPRDFHEEVQPIPRSA